MPTTHRVVTLVLPTMLLLDFAAPTQIFGHLGEGRYRYELAGIGPGEVPTSTGVAVVVPRGLEALAEADTIVVPGLGDWATATFPEAAAALAEAHRRGARIMSICTGAFLLAEAGLLDGRRATTHWYAADTLAERYPRVTVDPDVLYIDEGSILTSAGVAAGLDLCLHVVRRDHGAAVAADFARWSVIAPHREGGQAQFIPMPAAPAGRALSDEKTAAARRWALENLSRPVSVDQLAERADMPLRSFARRFVTETGTTPAQWLLEQRLRAAQTLLETSDQPVGRIARSCGFPNAAAMRAHFRRRLKTSPQAYRKSFGLAGG
ncbi:GlxA family transcriptional regulator [Actinoplanes sp. HUAS TT8]|uniref:GlxA family transcriptional regulator n=1 Tax=Actinoplanes sp. HUAS TT8 TaxID=3447453 RepID=UPI003F528F61